MARPKKDYTQYIEDNTLRCEASYRGGGIEIGLDELLKKDDGYCMTAYQNYLGGGLLGRICNSYNFKLEEPSKANQAKVEAISEQLKRYFHNLTNHEGDEWEEETFEENQLRKPVSAC